jgi:hypothetical protein
MENNILNIIKQSVWNVPGAEDEPSLTMENWSVWQCVDDAGVNTLHLTGWCVERYEGRASTAIVSVDKDKRCVFTESGRKYQLQGENGHDKDGDWVFSVFCNRNGLKTVKDVSNELFN